MGNRIKKGSFTVEAASIMPLVLLVVMGLLQLCFFVHNRTWLTAAAYEAAVSGSMEGIKKDGRVYETAEMKSRELGNSGFFGTENLRAETEVGRDVTVTYDADTNAGFGMTWHLHTEGVSDLINPTQWVRKIKTVSETMGKLGDGK